MISTESIIESLRGGLPEVFTRAKAEELLGGLVSAGSLAEKTGLRAGDRIVDIAGRPASGSGDAVAIIRRQPPGTWLPLRIARGDSQLDLIIQFPPQP